jgi:hypothetical protein
VQHKDQRQKREQVRKEQLKKAVQEDKLVQLIG